jgi:trehalose 6-phosphate synthase/phosphatase
MIRKKKPNATIGFFLHIPFPSFEVFRLLHKSWKEKLLRGVLGSDLIGFHTNEYVQHFLKTIRMVVGLDHQFRNVMVGNRFVKVDLFPLGIDYDKFHGATTIRKIVNHKNVILENFSDKKLIFSVDRLDYTKGLTQRLSGFERFLELHPEWHNKVVYIIGVVPSREIISKYNERKALLEEQVGHINGKYSTLEWQPIIYRFSHLPFEELSALYQAADVALITPLRDGMNLVAKEYVASRADQRGVLVLSELAGAASELGEALMVNPMDKEDLAHTIHQSLTMKPSKQVQKMALMQKRLIDYDVTAWVKDFLTQLSEVKTFQESRELQFVTPKLQ